MTLPDTRPAGQAPTYPYVWWWRVRLPNREGQRCRVTARGALNSIRVEFPDDFWVITSRWAVRREVAMTPRVNYFRVAMAPKPRVPHRAPTAR
jgi:hypothetical protein